MLSRPSQTVLPLIRKFPNSTHQSFPILNRTQLSPQSFDTVVADGCLSMIISKSPHMIQVINADLGFCDRNLIRGMTWVELRVVGKSGKAKLFLQMFHCKPSLRLQMHVTSYVTLTNKLIFCPPLLEHAINAKMMQTVTLTACATMANASVENKTG